MFVCVGVCVTVTFFVTDKSHRMSRSREIVTHYGQEAVCCLCALINSVRGTGGIWKAIFFGAVLVQ